MHRQERPAFLGTLGGKNNSRSFILNMHLKTTTCEIGIFERSAIL